MRVAVFLAFLLGASCLQAQPLWLRYPAISPDGEAILFCYHGDLYKVDSAGGEASQLTHHVGHDFLPVWSHDGEKIAFASDRHGNFDVFLMASTGGKATRLTVHSRSDYPSDFSPDGESVIFSSIRLDAPASIGFPSSRLPELYSVSVEGGAVSRLLTTPAEDARFDASGDRIAYHDRKGYENAWRKHHRSSIARDIWIYDRKTDRHTQVSTFEGEDRNPVWGEEGSLYYLSERSGSFNVWKTTDGEPVPVSDFKHHPVRFLSRAKDGTLCFSYHGEIYTQIEGEEPRRVEIAILTGDKRNPSRISSSPGIVTDIAISPNAKEMAYISRGEVFVTSLDHGSTKRITDTPEQERSVSFHPNGRKLLFASERGQSWNLYESSIERDEEKLFHLSTVLKEAPIVETQRETFQPRYSPDGKKVAFLEERTTLRVIDLESGDVKTVLHGGRNYSYTDGDQFFDWSPDSRWILSGMLGTNRWVEDVGLVPIEGGKVINLTNSGYFDTYGRWALDGSALLWFSDRHGMRSHGSWGSQKDAYALFLTKSAYDKFRLSEEEFAFLQEEQEEKEKDEDKVDADEEAEKDEADEEKEVEPLEFQLEGLEDRRVRLTVHSSDLADAVFSKDGDRLFYLAQFEDGYDLWSQDFYKKETKLLTKFDKAKWDGRGSPPMELLYVEDPEELFVLSGGSVYRIDPDKGGKKKIEFGEEMTIDHAAERAHMFEHAWRQVKKKFYVEDLHGVDWDFYKQEYAKFLPHIDNNYDFTEMMSELLGELNASHTGSGYRPKFPEGDKTAALGVFLDPDHQGAGIRILEIIDKSPLIRAESEITPGVVIEKIDGIEIEPGASHFPLLNRKAGKRTLLSLFNPDNGERWEEVVKPISLGEEQQLLYERWVKTRRETTETLSKGRIGYVHVRGMNDESFRETYSEIFGKHNDKEALVVDTRFNGGGWLHDDLVTLLSGQEYIQFYPRRQGNLGGEPMFKWSKPSIVVVGESNYSDAHMFPFAYKELGVGKLVGMPIPGTGTAVWWETLIDPTVYFGIPQVGMLTPRREYLENLQLEPDIQIANTPEDTARGEDAQLRRAVEELLLQLKEQ